MDSDMLDSSSIAEPQPASETHPLSDSRELPVLAIRIGVSSDTATLALGDSSNMVC